MITHMRSATGLPARRIRNVSVGLLTIVAVTVLVQPALSQMGDTMDAPTSRADTVDRGTMQQPMMGMSEATMDIPHPFFTHMGLPDPVGHYALWVSGVAVREDGRTKGDFGIHLETGLFPRLGLHIRNDQVLTGDHTEIMLQYAAIQSRDGMSGVAPFGELEVPMRGNGDKFYGLVGVSAMWMASRIEMNGSLEYSPAEKGLEGSVSAAANAGYGLTPIAELVMESATGSLPRNSVIAGLKYRISDAVAIGLGYQLPISQERDYSNRLMLQTDFEW